MKLNIYYRICLWRSGPFSAWMLPSLIIYSIKITIDNTLSLPNVHQYPLWPNALGAIKFLKQVYLNKELIISWTSFSNTLILPVRKPNGRKCRFVQNLKAINKIVNSRHTVVPNPHTLLSAIPEDCQYFSVIDFSSAYFSIAVENESQYISLHWEISPTHWTVMPKRYTESPTYFS